PSRVTAANSAKAERRRVIKLDRPLDLRLTLRLSQHGNRSARTIMLGNGEVWRATRNAAGATTLRLVAGRTEVTATAWGPGAELALENVPDLLGENDNRTGFA